MAEGEEEIATNLRAAAVTEVTERRESVGGRGEAGGGAHNKPSEPSIQTAAD